MNVLAELHQEPDLKLNLKFEIEVLCKNLNIDIIVSVFAPSVDPVVPRILCHCWHHLFRNFPVSYIYISSAEVAAR